MVLALPVADATSGFRTYWAGLVARLDLPRIVEIPIAFRDREHGVSKMSLRIILEAFMRVTSWATSEFPRRRRSWSPVGPIIPGVTTRPSTP